VLAALANPNRRLRRLLATPRATEAFAPRISEFGERRPTAPEIERRTREEIERELGAGAVHQGIALLADPLQGPALAEALLHAERAPRAVHVVLDRASDPQNVGAVLRSAAAFGADAMILSRRHAPHETGALAKAASGALERVPLVRVANLVGALEAHKRAGFWCVGLDTNATATLSGVERQAKLALVFGSEGGGLRRLTREHCDELVRVPIAAGSQSLNLAAAAAIALYEAARRWT
jgi:23S rRNA (guanosine2251-2'-O)-methyltransferase